MGENIEARQTAFDRIRRSMNVPMSVEISYVGSLLLLTALGSAYAFRSGGSVFLLGAALVLVAAVGFEYRTLSGGWRHRQRAVERAEPVPCSVCDTHVINKSDWVGLWDRNRYLPVVEFVYERAGERERSFFAYPYGVHTSSFDEQTSAREASQMTELAGDTAYYDPETEQAFLFDDPNDAVWWGHQKDFARTLLYRLVVASAVLFVGQTLHV
ncbi:hypothetical protein [Halosimplex sp. J119]